MNSAWRPGQPIGWRDDARANRWLQQSDRVRPMTDEQLRHELRQRQQRINPWDREMVETIGWEMERRGVA